MPTALELGRQLEHKRGELEQFCASRLNSRGQFDFKSVDDLNEFNRRNAELAPLHDQWLKAVDVERASSANKDALGALKTINRAGIFGGTATLSDGAYGYSGRHKSIGAQFVESGAYKSSRNDPRAEYSVEVEEGALKATLTTAQSLPYALQQPGAIPFATRRPVVADLLPQSSTDQPAVVYLEQTTQNFGADTVAEGALKPETSFGWTRRTVSFETIAHWIKVTNQTLEDSPAIRDVIDQQMLLGLQLAEEDQLLNGSGTAPDLQGFLTKSGVQTQAKGADNTFVAFMNALTKIRFTGRATPSGAIFHPNDWQDVVTYQDTTGRFIFGDPAALMQNMTLWGIPIIVTDAIAENTALVGDFQMYSRLWRKGGVRVIVGLEGDDLKRNQQTLVTEERAALQIDRASAFCVLTGI